MSALSSHRGPFAGTAVARSSHARYERENAGIQQQRRDRGSDEHTGRQCPTRHGGQRPAAEAVSQMLHGSLPHVDKDNMKLKRGRGSEEHAVLPITPPLPGQRGRKWHQRAINCGGQNTIGDRGDEDLPAAPFHLVERPDLRHPVVDEALWRVRRRGRIRQSLLPDKGGKIDPRLGFERRWVIYNGDCGSLHRAAELAWLDASHRGRASAAREDQAVSLGKAASAKSHRHARRLPAERLDFGARAAPKGTGDYKAWTPKQLPAYRDSGFPRPFRASFHMLTGRA